MFTLPSHIDATKVAIGLFVETKLFPPPPPKCCNREFAEILKSRTGSTKVHSNATKCYSNKPQFVEETGKEDKPLRLCSPSSHSRKKQNADFLSSDLFDRPAVCSRKSENWKRKKPERHRVLRRQNQTRHIPQL